MNPTKRRTVIAGNWKMNFTPAEAKAFIEAVKPMVAGKDNCDIIFCAPYVTIAAAQEAAKGSNIRIGAETAVLRGGDILLLSAEWPHSIRVTGQTPTRVFTMALELDGKGLERLGRLQTALSPSGFQALGDIIDYADDIFNITADSRQYTDSVDKDTTVSVKQILQAKIELFLLELLEQCPEAQDAAPVSRSQLVARTNEELRRHLCDSVSIEDICQRLNLS